MCDLVYLYFHTRPYSEYTLNLLFFIAYKTVTLVDLVFQFFFLLRIHTCHLLDTFVTQPKGPKFHMLIVIVLKIIIFYLNFGFHESYTIKSSIIFYLLFLTFWTLYLQFSWWSIIYFIDIKKIYIYLWIFDCNCNWDVF